MRDNVQRADLGSLQPEIDLAQWMDADLKVEMLDPVEEDDLPPAGSPTTIWIYTPRRLDA